ncbi:tripartite tricarboxylate transporter substrate binding protein [Aidingimonas halophila]|uniref:Tripartite-type tricarboxylate transporter, receptor component TctC n=1 Tax=Aidingimonas halophila TaxID=574349 RepID=A0A1H2SN68_9GAMM|nr:tripartite tricarboxylate transporter substrate binding protein [Aidingimonas halophila]GHC17373.1 C4-dicarboxylate ABC transporter substrate-binding protein [Aidingimonas halophila]SDW33103.1 Tripartite-type tricarboxylate transporter, receptor component TctC [Aidingimonas halophila]
MENMNKMSIIFVGMLTAGVANADYPTKSITMVIPYSAGGGTDVLARNLQPALEESLGEDIIVSNKPGGGGILGFTEVANADPDGYTVTIPNNVIFATEGMGNATYTYSDFDYLGNVLNDDYVVAVSDESEWDSWEELADEMRNNPGEVTFGFSGAGGSTHVASEILADTAEYEAKQVPHDGSSDAVAAALGGHIDVLLLNLADLSSGLKSGDLRLLATLGSETLEDYPDVPTMQELGHDISLSNWRGVAAPAGVDDEVKEAWSAALEKATNDPKVREAIAAQGGEVDFMPSGEKLDARMADLAESFINTAEKIK